MSGNNDLSVYTGPLMITPTATPETLRELARMENAVRKRAERRGLRLVKSRERNMHAFWIYDRESGELLAGDERGWHIGAIGDWIKIEDAIDRLVAEGAIVEVAP